MLLRGVVTQHGECPGHVEAEALGQLPGGLLDDDGAVQRCLKLFGQCLAAAQVPLVQQADGGEIGQRLPHALPGRVERTRIGAEQVERPDDVASKPHSVKPISAGQQARDNAPCRRRRPRP